MRIYVVMTKKPSPIAVTFPRMHSAYKTRKEANLEQLKLEQKAISNVYWVESVKLSGDKP